MLGVLSEVNTGWLETSLSPPKVRYLSGWQLISNSTCMEQPDSYLAPPSLCPVDSITGTEREAVAGADGDEFFVFFYIYLSCLFS